MTVHPADRAIVQWAAERGYVFAYVREYGLPEPCLRVWLGLSSAFFRAGRLVHWLAHVDGCKFDLLMFELASLFGFCASARAWPRQEQVVPSGTLAGLPSRGGDSN